MAQVINTNIPSLNAQRNLDRSQGSLHVALQRLSSGLRINSAKDDAAGLAISTRFTAQINGLNQAWRNANDGISLAQTMEGDLQEITNNLQRIRVLSIQAANATNSSLDRISLNNEVRELTDEINRRALTSKFNGVNLLDGNFTSQVFQVGPNGSSNDIIIFNFTGTFTSVALFSGVAVTITGSNSVIRTKIDIIDVAIDKVSAARSKLGAIQNRFESVTASLRITAENLSASRSRIMDADFAQETAEMTRNQILQQAGTAMLSQANTLPTNVLTLLR